MLKLVFYFILLHFIKNSIRIIKIYVFLNKKRNSMYSQQAIKNKYLTQGEKGKKNSSKTIYANVL